MSTEGRRTAWNSEERLLSGWLLNGAAKVAVVISTMTRTRGRPEACKISPGGGMTSRFLTTFTPARVSASSRKPMVAEQGREEEEEEGDTLTPLSVVPPSGHQARVVAVDEEVEDVEPADGSDEMPVGHSAATVPSSAAASAKRVPGKARMSSPRGRTRRFERSDTRSKFEHSLPDAPRVSTHIIPLTNLPGGLRVTPEKVTVTLDRAGGLGGPCAIAWAEDIFVARDDHSPAKQPHKQQEEEQGWQNSGGACSSDATSEATAENDSRRIRLRRQMSVLRRKGYSPMTQLGTRHGADGRRLLSAVAVKARLLLPAGTCNLYVFPRIKTADEPQGGKPSARGIVLLEHILHFLATLPPTTGHASNAFDAPDPVRLARAKKRQASMVHIRSTCDAIFWCSMSSTAIASRQFHTLPPLTPPTLRPAPPR